MHIEDFKIVGRSRTSSRIAMAQIGREKGEEREQSYAQEHVTLLLHRIFPLSLWTLTHTPKAFLQRQFVYLCMSFIQSSGVDDMEKSWHIHCGLLI